MTPLGYLPIIALCLHLYHDGTRKRHKGAGRYQEDAPILKRTPVPARMSDTGCLGGQHRLFRGTTRAVSGGDWGFRVWQDGV
ncbi:MAG: hypothetical protein IJT11_10450 [Bacteroidaceae bacterium]|nr:hypothetical protein [Bacteroidaceae bacterium]